VKTSTLAETFFWTLSAISATASPHGMGLGHVGVELHGQQG
jgi:hypothetical protein